jgi:hypothetical protein
MTANTSYYKPNAVSCEMYDSLVKTRKTAPEDQSSQVRAYTNEQRGLEYALMLLSEKQRDLERSANEEAMDPC